jgi:hypothetical protein
MLVHLRALAPHDVSKVRSEDKWCTLSLDTEFLFEVSQEVTKVNVKQVSSSCDLMKNTVVQRKSHHARQLGPATMMLSL